MYEMSEFERQDFEDRWGREIAKRDADKSFNTDDLYKLRRHGDSLVPEIVHGQSRQLRSYHNRMGRVRRFVNAELERRRRARQGASQVISEDIEDHHYQGGNVSGGENDDVDMSSSEIENMLELGESSEDEEIEIGKRDPSLLSLPQSRPRMNSLPAKNLGSKRIKKSK
jgi:hypothetical protein